MHVDQYISALHGYIHETIDREQSKHIYTNLVLMRSLATLLDYHIAASVQNQESRSNMDIQDVSFVLIYTWNLRWRTK